MLPLIAAFISEMTKSPLYSAQITTYLSLFFAAITTILFIAQYIAARLLKVNKTDLL